jgi:hypothetical protein
MTEEKRKLCLVENYERKRERKESRGSWGFVN